MEIKSGLKSTEFYTTLIPGVASLLVLTGVIAPENASEAGEMVAQIVSGVVAAVTFVAYLAKRTDLKKTTVLALAEKEIAQGKELG